MKTSSAVQAATNLVDLVLAQGQEGQKVAAKHKVAGVWQDVTWGQILERVRKVSEGLVALGLKPGDRVCIFADTRLDWCIADFAIMGTGATSVPIYASNTAHETEYIINNSGARFVVVDNDQGKQPGSGRWSRLKSVADKLATVEKFIAMDLPSNEAEKLLSLADVEARGAEALKANPRGLEERARTIKSDDLSCILYTSGTTGNPKGVMLSHGNWTYQAKALTQVGLMGDTDVVLLFLPLAHSFAKVVEAAWLGQGFNLAFAESVERAVDNAAEVKATILPAVPRVFEKAFNKVAGDGASAPGIKGKLFVWAMRLFEEYAAARTEGREYGSLQWAFAKKLVFSKIEEKLKARFGGRMRLFISGGAPLGRKIAFFFDLCGLKILEGYGLTETSAPTHANRLERIRIGTVGQPFPDTEVKLAAEDKEILVRGPQIMKGYYNMPEETKAVLEPDGWFHTGDIGEIDSEGFLRITDRKKDLIKTSGGKYIAPQELENALKTEALISQVLIHGDRRKFVSALVTVSEENARKWAQENNLSFGSVAELTQKPEVRARMQAAIDALNAVQPSYSTVKKFAVLDHDWSQETGELTPTLKVKRKFVNQKYKKILDDFYDGESFD
jgi:long-chain acyl-CoA synthetase